MQNVTGSIGSEKEAKLTPFEQADYNLARFVVNVQLSDQLQVAIKQLEALEILKKRYETALEGNESFTTGLPSRQRLLAIKDEIATVEFLIKTICIAHEQEN